MQHVSTYNSHLQANLRTITLGSCIGCCFELDLALPEDDYCKSKHVALALYSIIVVLTTIYSNTGII